MRNRAVVDLHAISLDDLLAQAGRLLGTSLDIATMRFGGKDHATCGVRTGRDTWVRLQHRRADDATTLSWSAEEDAASISGVRKPAWHQAVSWHDDQRGVRWRADELDLVTSPVLGWDSGLYNAELQLSDAWWDDLNCSLKALAHQPTARISVSQETITGYITGVLDSTLDTHVNEWTTAHGDLVWSNLTREGHLLDWEYWGRAPRGYDAAQLWGVALSRPDIAARIEEEFTDLNTRSGRIAQLFWCALARCAAEQHQDYAHYRELTNAVVPRLLRSLNQP